MTLRVRMLTMRVRILSQYGMFLVLVNRSRVHIRSISRHKDNAKSFIVDETEEEGEVSDQDVTGSEEGSESAEGSESGDASESSARC
jgi:hypothetical protein